MSQSKFSPSNSSSAVSLGSGPEASPSAPVPSGHPQRWLIFATVGSGIFLATLDGSIVNLALPTLIQELKTSFVSVQWVVLAYLLTIVALTLTAGRLGDTLGKRKIYFGGYALFALSSAFCGLSPSIHWLIAARVLQGIGAAMVTGLGAALISEAFAPRERGRAMGAIGSVVALGIITGPVLGGLILSRLSWHWIFFVNLPVALVGLFCILRFIPASPPAGPARFDLLGALWLALCLGGMLLALTSFQDQLFAGWIEALMLLGSLGALGLFIFTERRHPAPLLDFKLFRASSLALNLGAGMVSFVCTAGLVLLMPFYLQNVRGLSAQQAGLMLAIVPVLIGISAPLAGILADKLGNRPVALIGMGLLALGYLCVSTLGVDTGTVGYLLRFVPMGLGAGLFQAPNNNAVMGAAPRSQLGVVSGLLSNARSLGQVLGVALIGALWNLLMLSRLPAGAELAKVPPAIQVYALQWTCLAMAALSAIGWLLIFATRPQPGEADSERPAVPLEA